MRLIKCDVCNKELDDYNVYTTMDFINYGSGIDLCEECRNVYKDLEQSYLEEQNEIYEKKQKDIINLQEKYKKEILKLKK